MFQTLRNAWKIPDLRKKILYTLLMLLIFRLGSFIPVPGLTADAIGQMMGGFAEGMQGLINNFSGGALERGSIFAMSITPYINSSIIIQLLTVAIPALEKLQKEGEEGRKKISQYTRYGAVILGFIQASGLYIGLKGNIIGGASVMNFIIIVLTFTAGTAFLMWLGEEITDKGIGNGISLLIFTGIVSRGPAMIQSLRATLFSGDTVSIQSVITLIVILAIAVISIGFVVLMNDAERRIPVQYAKRVVGRKMYGGQSPYPDETGNGRRYPDYLCGIDYVLPADDIDVHLWTEWADDRVLGGNFKIVPADPSVLYYPVLPADSVFHIFLYRDSVQPD